MLGWREDRLGGVRRCWHNSQLLPGPTSPMPSRLSRLNSSRPIFSFELALCHSTLSVVDFGSHREALLDFASIESPHHLFASSPLNDGRVTVEDSGAFHFPRRPRLCRHLSPLLVNALCHLPCLSTYHHFPQSRPCQPPPYQRPHPHLPPLASLNH